MNAKQGRRRSFARKTALSGPSSSPFHPSISPPASSPDHDRQNRRKRQKYYQESEAGEGAVEFEDKGRQTHAYRIGTPLNHITQPNFQDFYARSLEELESIDLEELESIDLEVKRRQKCQARNASCESQTRLNPTVFLCFRELRHPSAAKILGRA
ncbi:hypothetical protein C8R42DRAFT_648645 [Lentinula raphanica]|nr:hypothetical protein C8R42DRAFT_648645 [Lentinula raphanica]